MVCVHHLDVSTLINVLILEGCDYNKVLIFHFSIQFCVRDRLFAAVDDMFCIFEGHIENVPFLKQQYGLTKTATEVTIVIEAYRTLRDRGPYSADQVVRDFHGKFAFMLFDCSTKNVFLAGVSLNFASFPFDTCFCIM